MKHNDNSSRLDDDAVASAALLSQEPQPALKPKRKKLKVIAVILLFLFVASAAGALLVMPFPTSWLDDVKLEEAPTPLFYVSKDGVLFDLSTSDPAIVRAAANKSLGIMGSINFFYRKSVTASGGSVTTIEEIDDRLAVVEDKYDELSYEQLSNYLLYGNAYPSLGPSTKGNAYTAQPPPLTTYMTYSMVTRDADSKEVLASERLCAYRAPASSAGFRCILSEDKLLFYRSKGKRLEYFWYVKSNDQWTEIPIDFGIKGDSYVRHYEVVKENGSILFLIQSEEEPKAWASNYNYQLEKEKKVYMASYNYETFSLEKTIEIPSRYFVTLRPYFNIHGPNEWETVSFGVLSGAQHFAVYQFVEGEKTDAINCAVFSTKDLTKVKEITVPNVKERLCPGSSYSDIIISPDLRYVAYGDNNLYLYDVELQKEYCLRSYVPAFFKRVAAEACQKRYDSDYRRVYPSDIMWRSQICSCGFSKDSRFLIAADYLGNVYQWDVQNKKRARKIINSKY